MQCSRQIHQLLKILTLLPIEIVSKERGKMRELHKKNQCYLAVIRGPNCTSKS